MPEIEVKPDKGWFQEQLAKRAMSQRQLAARMGVDPATISYLLNGDRKLGLGDLKEISDILQIPVEEIMRRWGYDVGRSTHVPVRGYVGDDCAVTAATEPFDRVETPPGISRDGYALQIRSPSVGVSLWDGLLCFIPSGLQSNPAEALGQMVVVHTADGQGFCGLLSRGYTGGTFNITHPRSGHVRENLTVNSAVPAQWFKAIR